MYPHAKQGSNTLAAFVADNKLEEKGLSLSELRRMPNSSQVSLVFDGNRFLDDVVQEVHATCPLTIFTASTPLAAYTIDSEYSDMIDSLTNVMASQKLEFKPMVVFNGCGFLPREDTDNTSPPQPSELMGYTAYNRSKGVRSVPTDVLTRFAQRFTVEEDVEGLIVRRMSEKAEETLRAPYLAWSQIAAFFAPSNTVASEVFGALELLAFPGIERVITNIDIERGTFDCVAKSPLMAALRRRYDSEFSEEDFAAIALYDTKNRLFCVKKRRDNFDELCRLPRDPTRVAGFLKYGRSTDEQKELFQRNLAALDAPIFTVDARIVPLHELYNLPRHRAIAHTFGKPMPIVFYYCMMSGPLLPLPFAIHSQAVLVDDWPLIDTSAYRRAAEAILPLRVQIAFQLFQIASRQCDFYWIRQYVVTRKAGAADATSRICKLSSPPTIALAYWELNEQRLVQSAQDTMGVYFTSVLPYCGGAVEMPVMYNTVEATLAVVYLRSLDFLGYFTHATDGAESSGPSVYCKALERFDCATLSEYGVLLIELMRTGTLTDDPLPVMLDRVAEKYPRGVRFASRMVSIIPTNVSGPWTGPFDSEMAAFGVITRLFSRTMRVLHEVVTTLIFASGRTAVPWEQFGSVIRQLPFALPTEFSAGFLMTYVLCNPQCTLEELSIAFPELYALPQDLETLFWFFSMGFEAIRVLNYEEPLRPEMNAVVNEARMLVGHACERFFPEMYDTTFPKDPIELIEEEPVSDEMMQQELMQEMMQPGMQQGMPMGLNPVRGGPMPRHMSMEMGMGMNMGGNMHYNMDPNMKQYQHHQY